MVDVMGKIYESRNPLIRWYIWRRLKHAVKLAELDGKIQTILDFGCEAQWLKKAIPSRHDYVGFDIDKKHSDIKDYTRLSNVDVVFSLSVFEHLTAKDLHKTLKAFRRMGIKKLIVELPREDEPVNRLATFLLGLEFEHFLNHKLTWRQATEIIAQYYECEKVTSVLFISWISLWKEK